MTQCDLQHRLVAAVRHAHDPVFFFADVSAYEDGDGSRYERHRENQRAEQGENDCESHRLEHLSLDAREREYRDVHNRDDEHSHEARHEDFVRGTGDDGESLILVQHASELSLPLAHATQAVLRDHDGPVHDQAEVERAETHQVTAHPIRHHARHREQHGERDHKRRDERGAQISEEEEQHGDDEQCALEQVLRHRADRPIHEQGAVVDRVDRDARRQGRANQLEPLGHTLRDGPAVLADQHHGRAEHNFLAVLCGSASAQLLADPDGCEVT